MAEQELWDPDEPDWSGTEGLRWDMATYDWSGTGSITDYPTSAVVLTKDQMLRKVGARDDLVNAIGKVFGNQDQHSWHGASSLNVNQMPSHSHTHTRSNQTPSHSHSIHQAMGRSFLGDRTVPWLPDVAQWACSGGGILTIEALMVKWQVKIQTDHLGADILVLDEDGNDVSYISPVD